MMVLCKGCRCRVQLSKTLFENRHFFHEGVGDEVVDFMVIVLRLASWCFEVIPESWRRA